MERRSDDIITLLMKFLENNADIRRVLFFVILEHQFKAHLLFNYFIVFYLVKFESSI